MPIPMEIPARFLQALLDGRLVRYGCILKETTTGQIVGHLKELDRVSRILSGIPLNPGLAGASAVVQIGQWIDTHHQLGQIRQVLDRLQLVSSIGAVASVAGLGVSVAGFALVLSRLARLEQNLNQGMDHIRAEVEKLNVKMDLLHMAKLTAAWEKLAGASQTDLPERTDESLKEAAEIFQIYRNYYYELIREVQPLGRPELSLPQVRQLYGRFFACAVAELEANFLLHDFAKWRCQHAIIAKQLADTCGLDAPEMFRCRVDGLGGRRLFPGEANELREQVLVTRDTCWENRARIETAGEEVLWLERHKLTPWEYLHVARNVPDHGFVLLLNCLPETLRLLVDRGICTRDHVATLAENTDPPLVPLPESS
jgi:hypothetical protein